MFCEVPKEDEDQEGLTEWEGRINILKKLIRQSEKLTIEKSQEVEDQIKHEISGLEAKLNENINTKIKNLEQRVQEKIEILQNTIINTIKEMNTSKD